MKKWIWLKNYETHFKATMLKVKDTDELNEILDENTDNLAQDVLIPYELKDELIKELEKI